MVGVQHRWMIVFVLLAIQGGGYAQSSPTAQLSPDGAAVPALNPPVNSGAKVASTYTFPDGKQQFHNYLYSAFGPPALISSAIGAVLDQNKPAPPEWDSGAQGYAERYGWRFGMQLISKTTEYSLSAVVHEDVTYHRCDCNGLVHRSSHALVSTLTAKTTSGQTIFSVPALVSPYGGSFAAMNAWYPSRYEPADAFRIGSTSFVFKAVGNLVGEFLAPGR
jgi:hypothetical protein